MPGTSPRTRRISRRIPKDIGPLVTKHARQVGEVLWAWNQLHDQLFVLFWQLIGDPYYHAAHAIWHTIQSDQTQREMLLAAAETRLPPRSQTMANIQWIIKQAGRLSAYRNDSAHTPLSFALIEGIRPELIPAPFSSRTAARKRLRERPLSAVWRLVRGDLYALGTFTGEVRVRLANPNVLAELGPLPQRPRLLAPGPLMERASKTPRLRRKRARRRRRRASRRKP